MSDGTLKVAVQADPDGIHVTVTNPDMPEAFILEMTINPDKGSFSDMSEMLGAIFTRGAISMITGSILSFCAGHPEPDNTVEVQP